MLQFISWPQYWLFILIATAAYYLYIWIVFYRTKFALPGGFAEDSPDEVMSTAQHIIDELRPLFADRTNKQELILALQSKLKKYAAWNETNFRDLVNQFIADQSQSKCSIHLSEEDQRVLWL